MKETYTSKLAERFMQDRLLLFNQYKETTQTMMTHASLAGALQGMLECIEISCPKAKSYLKHRYENYKD